MFEHVDAVHSPNAMTVKHFGQRLGINRLKAILQTKAHRPTVSRRELADFISIGHGGGNGFLYKQRFIAPSHGTHHL